MTAPEDGAKEPIVKLYRIPAPKNLCEIIGEADNQNNYKRKRYSNFFADSPCPCCYAYPCNIDDDQPPKPITKRRKLNPGNPFPESVYDLLEQPPPPPEKCTTIRKMNKFVKRNPKRKKPAWYLKSQNQECRAKIIYKDGKWQKYSIVMRPVTGQLSAKENMIQISSRGSKRFVQVINCDYCEMHLKMFITQSNGHFLADPLSILEQSDVKEFVNIGTQLCRRSTSIDYEDNFHFVELSLPPRMECTLLQLGPPNPARPFDYVHEQSWGDPSKSPDSDFLWLVPVSYKGPILCSQGFNGGITHQGNLRYAVDIAVKENTQVICPRDGIVLDFVSHFKKTGESQTFETRANYLTLYHDDGTVSEYVHLKHNGVFVELGEVVKKGQIIASSGNTGWSYGPHLHFHVRRSPNKGSNSICIKFDDGTEDGIELHTGQYYY